MSNAANFPILSTILFTPAVGAVLLLFISRRQENLIRWIANIFAFAGFLVSLPLWFYYDPAKYGTYMEQLGIKYPTIKGVVP